jgi:hypothetical protein
MPVLQASRRLVKSPPELWAEVSDAASLARHLGEVGEITITRLEPETTVAWEGERASGTVELAPAGWGTAVTLTAEPIGDAAAPEPQPAAPEPPAAAPEPEPKPEPDPEPVAEPEPEPVAAAESEPTPEPPRRGLLARLFRRRAAEPEPSPADRAGGATEDDSATPLAESPRVATGPARSSAEPEPDPQPPAEPEPAPEPEPEPARDPLESVLTSALDSLGAAHHRPFSRG